MKVSVSTNQNDRIDIDMTDDELARLRAVARKRLGRTPTKRDMRKVLSSAISLFCQEGGVNPSGRAD